MKFKIILLLTLCWFVNLTGQGQYVWGPKSSGADNSYLPTSFATLNNGKLFMQKYKAQEPWLYYESDDLGVSWSAVQTTGLQNVKLHKGIRNIDSELILLGLGNSWESVICVSSDNGQSWVENATGIQSSFIAMDIIKISSSKWLLLGTLTSGNGNTIIYESNDQRQSWTLVNSIGIANSYTGIALKKINNSVFLTCFNQNMEESKIYKSLDEGYSWQEINFPFYTGFYFVDMQDRDGDQLFLTGSTQLHVDKWEFGIYYTNDEGLTWDSVITSGLDDLGVLYSMLIIDNSLIIGGEHKDKSSGAMVFSSPLAPVGLNEKQNQNFSVYPNPFNDELFIDNQKNEEVIITNITGQVVLKSRGEVIGTSSLPKGVYIVSVGTRSQKLVKN